MSESTSHRRVKSKASGETEVEISRNRRIDSMSKKRATEVERSGSSMLLRKAASRLRASRKKQKILVVPNNDIIKAVDAMKNARVKGTVKNLSGTNRRTV